MIADISPLIASMIEALPLHYKSIVTVVSLAILITLYSLFIWKFYRFVAKKDLLKLNLARYNQSDHPLLNKLGAVFFYFIEYIIILPFLIFFWFAVFALIIFLLLENASVITALNLAAAVVAAIRILAYYKSELAQEVAKLFPLTVLIIFMANAKISPLVDLAKSIALVPPFFNSIAYYFIFIAGLELLLRVLDLLFDYNEED